MSTQDPHAHSQPTATDTTASTDRPTASAPTDAGSAGRRAGTPTPGPATPGSVVGDDGATAPMTFDPTCTRRCRNLVDRENCSLPDPDDLTVVRPDTDRYATADD